MNEKKYLKRIAKTRECGEVIFNVINVEKVSDIKVLEEQDAVLISAATKNLILTIIDGEDLDIMFKPIEEKLYMTSGGKKGLFPIEKMTLLINNEGIIPFVYKVANYADGLDLRKICNNELTLQLVEKHILSLADKFNVVIHNRIEKISSECLDYFKTKKYKLCDIDEEDDTVIFKKEDIFFAVDKFDKRILICYDVDGKDLAFVYTDLFLTGIEGAKRVEQMLKKIKKLDLINKCKSPEEFEHELAKIKQEVLNMDELLKTIDY